VPRTFGGDVGLECTLQNVLSKTRAIVGDCQTHTQACASQAGLDAHAAHPLACGILRILNKVVNDLPDLLRICLDQRAVGCQVRPHRHSGRVVQGQHLGHQCIQIEAVQFSRRQPGVVTKLVDQPLHGIDLVNDGLDRLGQQRLIGALQFAIELHGQALC
jgi:hypothetical protein